MGHLGVCTSVADDISSIIYPSNPHSESSNYPRKITLNAPQTVLVTQEDSQVFQYFQPEDTMERQLDVTVTAAEADVPANQVPANQVPANKVSAYLIVSPDCKDVERDSIAKAHSKGGSTRLSFEDKGRLTVPPPTDSERSLCIGIGIKNATGDSSLNETKSVTLAVTLSEPVNSSFSSISLSVLFSAGFGYLISYLAMILFSSMSDRNTITPEEIGAVDQEEQRPRFSSRASNWFNRSLKMYANITTIVGFVLLIDAVRVALDHLQLMRDEGDRDNCYYNDFCYRVIPWYDIPLNSTISNIVYIIHGMILGQYVFLYHLPFSGCAFAWAMIFQGLFSAVYHLCPNKLTFQFDIAFMVVMAGLIVIFLYNGTARVPVEAEQFFLYFLVPVLFFNFIGAVGHSKTGLPALFEILVFIILAIWLVGIFIWAGSKLFETETNQSNRNYVLFSLGVIIPVVVLSYWRTNLPQAILFSCIAESSLAILVKFYFQCKRQGHPYLRYKILYVVIMGVLWIVALYFFFGKATTDKAETPEKSRNLNQDCIKGGFFDDHDLWHILSSHALLMTVYLVMSMSKE